MQKAKASTPSHPLTTSLSPTLSLPAGRASSQDGYSQKSQIDRRKGSTSAPTSPQKRSKRSKKKLSESEKNDKNFIDLSQDSGDSGGNENEDVDGNENKILCRNVESLILSRGADVLDSTKSEQIISLASAGFSSFSIPATPRALSSSETPLTPSSNSVSLGPGSPATGSPYVRSNSWLVAHSPLPHDDKSAPIQNVEGLVNKVGLKGLQKRKSVSGSGSGSERTLSLSKTVNGIAAVSKGSTISKRSLSTTAPSIAPVVATITAVRKLSIGIECRVYDENCDDGPPSQDRWGMILLYLLETLTTDCLLTIQSPTSIT